MITTVTNDKCYIIFGKKDDVKPTKNIGNGSQFIEQDTGKIYFFDEENQKWLEFEKTGGKS